MYYSESKKRWMDFSEMNTQHIINALRKGLDLSQKTMLDELVKRQNEALETEQRALAEVTDTYVITVRRQS